MGGIRKAARELEIDHAVVSRHIRSLEEWLATKLVVRQGNETHLTEEGSSYFAEITKSLSVIANATGKLLHPEHGTYRLHLSSIPGFGSLWLADRLNGFMAANPSVRIDFRPTDATPDLRSSNFDVDIRYLRDWEVPHVEKALRRMEFARPKVFPLASPQLLKRGPRITGAKDLIKYTLIHENNDSEWRNWLGAQGIEIDSELAGPRLWHAHITLNAARSGQGLVLANRLLVQNDLKAGNLVEVKPERGSFKKVQFGGYTMLARDDRWNSPPIAQFRRWLQTISIE